MRSGGKESGKKRNRTSWRSAWKECQSGIGNGTCGRLRHRCLRRKLKVMGVKINGRRIQLPSLIREDAGPGSKGTSKMEKRGNNIRVHQGRQDHPSEGCKRCRANQNSLHDQSQIKKQCARRCRAGEGGDYRVNETPSHQNTTSLKIKSAGANEERRVSSRVRSGNRAKLRVLSLPSEPLARRNTDLASGWHSKKTATVNYLKKKIIFQGT